jgi:hypothetical protein
MHPKKGRKRRIGARQLLARQTVGSRADRRTAISANQPTNDTQLSQLLYPVSLEFTPFPELRGARRDSLLRPGMDTIPHRALVIGKEIVDAVEVSQRDRSFVVS